jgi:hypothetical protein
MTVIKKDDKQKTYTVNRATLGMYLGRDLEEGEVEWEEGVQVEEPMQDSEDDDSE